MIGPCRSTLSTPDKPLIVLNNQIVNQEMLETLIPDQIKEIKVLKGDAATALYGTQASLGVILITTKGKLKRK